MISSLSYLGKQERLVFVIANEGEREGRRDECPVCSAVNEGNKAVVWPNADNVGVVLTPDVAHGHRCGHGNVICVS